MVPGEPPLRFVSLDPRYHWLLRIVPALGSAASLRP